MKARLTDKEMQPVVDDLFGKNVPPLVAAGQCQHAIAAAQLRKAWSVAIQTIQVELGDDTPAEQALRDAALGLGIEPWQDA